MIYVQDPDLTIHVGDVRDVLPTLDAGSVDCVVTSPPYWGLRDYGTDGQLGLEATPDLYVQSIVAVFREVRRVLADHGTCWVNLGSSYASGDTPTSQSHPGVPAYGSGDREPADSTDPGFAYRDLCDGCLDDFRSHRGRTSDTRQPHELDGQPLSTTGRDSGPEGSGPASLAVSPLDAPASTTLRSWLQQRAPCSRCASRASALSDARSSVGDAPASAHMSWLNYTRALKPKDMVPTPWMVAMALQADGWYLRSDIVWSKPNPMPESVTDRPTKSHEYVFLLSKFPRYFFDQEAVREKYQYGENGDHPRSTATRYEAPGQAPHTGLRRAGLASGPDGRRKTTVRGADGSLQHRDGERWPNGGRNVRSVWEIATQPYAEAHFATFPEELARRCILAGCPEQVCGTCGKPRERIVERERVYDHTTTAVTTLADRNDLNGGAGAHDVRHGPSVRTETLGWSDCGHGNYRPGVVLDPFLGSGTSALVARKHGRRCVGVELSRPYAALAARRCQQLSLLAEAGL